jgi:ATP-dependent Lhr-like helicase
LELIEVAALKEAVKQKVIEPRDPQVLCFDVLVQFLMTLAVGDGFYPRNCTKELKSICFSGNDG